MLKPGSGSASEHYSNYNIALVVSLVAIHKGEWTGKRLLDGHEASTISAFLENSADGREPAGLRMNAGRLFQGSIILGDGFLLTHSQAASLVDIDLRNREVICPVINGQEINNEPSQEPGRSIINFRSWSQEQASQFEAPFEIVERSVRPVRATNNRPLYREAWWLYAEPRPGLVKAIRPLHHCFVASATTKYLNFSATPTNYVFTHALFIFATDRWDLYVVLQSTLHEVWARKYSGALETRLRYSPTDCFGTFAFPEGLWQTTQPALTALGERYHEHRAQLMRSLWLGLTDIYNLFHARDITPELVAKISKKSHSVVEQGYNNLLELRRLHRELDDAVRIAYGWDGLDLGHDFFEVETLPEEDRVRYTISPSARKEVLHRLLALNQERAAEEAAVALEAKKKTKTKKQPLTISAMPSDLFIQPTSAVALADAWARPMQDHRAETGAQLAALLKAMNGPLPKRQVILAAILALEPSLLLPYLDTQEAATWRHGIGREADPLPPGITPFIAKTDPAWGTAVRNLRTNGYLVENLQDGTWAPGANLDVFATTGWPDGRAGMVLDVLKRQSADTIITTLPTSLRGWIDAAAA